MSPSMRRFFWTLKKHQYQLYSHQTVKREEQKGICFEEQNYLFFQSTLYRLFQPFLSSTFSNNTLLLKDPWKWGADVLFYLPYVSHIPLYITGMFFFFLAYTGLHTVITSCLPHLELIFLRSSSHRSSSVCRAVLAASREGGPQAGPRSQSGLTAQHWPGGSGGCHHL